ncbi:hypothetical protein STEG23_004765 [Scotinomys teguina]
MSTRTPLDHKVDDPYPTQRARPLELWIDKPRPALQKPHESNSTLQEHPEAIGPEGPRSTRMPLDQKVQEHPDTIGPGGPNCNQMILDQHDPGAPQTSLDQKVPEAFRPRGPRSTQTALDKENSRASRPHWTKSPTLAPFSEAETGRHQ